MSVPAKCRNCGYEHISNAFHFENSTNITISGAAETCPRCGGKSILQDGSYDFVGSVISAFRAPNVSRQQVLEFQSIAKSVAEGEKDLQTATTEVSNLGLEVSQAWEWANDNAGALGLLLAIIGMFLAHYHFKKSKDDHSATEALQKNTEALQKIEEELSKISDTFEKASEALQPKKQLPKEPPIQKPTRPTQNRQQRRRAKSLAKKKKKQS